MRVTIFFGFVKLLSLFLCVACARLDTLTPTLLEQAEAKWRASRPGFYRLAIEMEGDRVEPGRFEVVVRAEQVVGLRRNGQVILPERGQEYSMEGLFKMLRQELSLVEKPTLLGAPPGFSAYPMAKFDENTGRLIHYRRTVGGTDNTIDIRVVDYEATP